MSSAKTASSTAIGDLAGVIASRKGGDPAASYTAKLLGDGLEACARKFGEEAVELIIAALSGRKAETAGEAADVIYHLLVTLEAADVPFADVLAALESRQGASGLAEKAARRRGA